VAAGDEDLADVRDHRDPDERPEVAAQGPAGPSGHQRRTEECAEEHVQPADEHPLRRRS
jgi:hypothetical protein